MSTLKTNNIQHVDAASPSISLDTGGNITVTGIITATSFSGSGANLTGIAATANVVTNSLVVSGVSTFAAGSASAPSISPTGDSNTGIFFPSADTIAFAEGGAEVSRFDSSGRLLVGTTSAVTNGFAQYARLLVKGYTFTSTGPGTLAIISGTNAASYAGDVGAGVGVISFGGADGYEFARINCSSDATTSAGDYPGRLVFSTTADGASSPTERMRINSSGNLVVGTEVGTTSSNNQRVLVTAANEGATTYGLYIHNDSYTAGRARISLSPRYSFAYNTAPYIESLSESTSAASLILGSTTGSTATERIRITSGGQFCQSSTGSYTSTTYNNFHQGDNTIGCMFRASHATYADSIITTRADRVANSVYVFIDGWSAFSADREFYIRGDGNGYCDGSWSGGGADYAEYFEWSDGNLEAEDRRGISVVLDGNRIREAVAGEEPIGVISGNPSVIGDAAATKWIGKYLRDDYGSYILDENGERQLNPAHDPDQEYVSREDRPEWDCVGLMGKLRIRKGQVTGARWIKMRDISDSVEEWLVR